MRTPDVDADRLAAGGPLAMSTVVTIVAALGLALALEYAWWWGVGFTFALRYPAEATRFLERWGKR